MYSVAMANQENRLSLKLPYGRPVGQSQVAQVHAHLHPSCRYSLRVSWSLQEKMGQVRAKRTSLWPLEP